MGSIKPGPLKNKVKLAIVVSRWNEQITKSLLEGAKDTLKTAGVKKITVVHVPGTWEIPLVVQELLPKVDGVVALGCIMQGATNHAGLLASDVSSSLMSLQLDFAKPVTWGIITPENQEQALERAGIKQGNKGREAAGALLEVLSVLEQS